MRDAEPLDAVGEGEGLQPGPLTTFLERLRAGPTLLLDGGLGTYLIARGLSRGAAPESWVLERPTEILGAHRAYVEAGSEAVHATTFGANPIRLAAAFGRGASPPAPTGARGVGSSVAAAAGLDGGCERINVEAVRLASGSGARFVLADVGPTGDYLPPVGTADEASWRTAYRRQAKALAASNADALHVETMTDLREALVALECLKTGAPSLPVLVSMTFQRKKRGFFTIMGDPLSRSLKALAAAGADAVGANCTLTSADMRDLAAEARASVDIPLVLQPNAGLPEIRGEELLYSQEPAAFADDMAAVAELGIQAVGGCCGTDPRFIRALAARLGPRGRR